MNDKDKTQMEAQRITRVLDLSADRSPAVYAITEQDGDTRTVTLQKRQRQVLDLLMRRPVYAASPVRLSDMVHLLKTESGIDIETVMYPGDPGTGTLRYGIYVLRSKIERLDTEEVAA